MNPMHLSRRERQLMDILYRLGSASAGAVLKEMPDPPSYSAVRSHLKILEDKGFVARAKDGPRYVYRPAVAPEKARSFELKRLLSTFFDDSPSEAVAALLDEHALTDEEHARLTSLIDQARREGR